MTASLRMCNPMRFFYMISDSAALLKQEQIMAVSKEEDKFQRLESVYSSQPSSGLNSAFRKELEITFPPKDNSFAVSLPLLRFTYTKIAHARVQIDRLRRQHLDHTPWDRSITIRHSVLLPSRFSLASPILRCATDVPRTPRDTKQMRCRPRWLVITKWKHDWTRCIRRESI